MKEVSVDCCLEFTSSSVINYVLFWLLISKKRREDSRLVFVAKVTLISFKTYSCDYVLAWSGSTVINFFIGFYLYAYHNGLHNLTLFTIHTNPPTI